MKKLTYIILFIVALLVFILGRAAVVKLFTVPGSNVVVVSEITTSVSTPEQIASSEHNTEVININTATAEELTALDGIGLVIAQRIVDYRTQYGDFVSVEELMEVSGIGEKKLEAIRKSVVLSD